MLALLAAAGLAAVPAAQAAEPPEGGLYIAGYGFGFPEVANRAISQNPGSRRFFVLALPPETNALRKKAPRALAAARDRVIAANGILFVCQRDIDNRLVDAATLMPGVIAVRGWPPLDDDSLPHGERYFKDEDRANLPASNEALRRLRATCSEPPAPSRRSR
jgi:hypothetical protein